MEIGHSSMSGYMKIDLNWKLEFVWHFKNGFAIKIEQNPCNLCNWYQNIDFWSESFVVLGQHAEYSELEFHGGKISTRTFHKLTIEGRKYHRAF